MRSIASVLGQTHRNVRVAVYDNASTDDTGAYVAAIIARDPRVRYMRRPDNVGGGANIELAMHEVTTPFFSILCDDDVLLPDFYAHAIAEFERFPEAMFVAASTLQITEDGTFQFAPAAYWDRDGLSPEGDGAYRMASGKHPTMTTVVFRRELIDEIGTIDVDTGALVDLDYYIRIAKRFRYVTSRRAGGLYVRHDATWTDNTTSLDRDFDRLIAKNATDARITGALAAQRDERIFQLAVWAIARDNAEVYGAYRDALRRRQFTARVRILELLDRASGLAPITRLAIRRIYTYLQWLRGRASLRRLRLARQTEAIDGYRGALRYFQGLRNDRAANESRTSHRESTELDENGSGVLER